MRFTRMSGEQILKVLREAEQLPVSVVALKHGVSDAAIYTWRRKFGAMSLTEVTRLREIEMKGGRHRKT